MKNQHKLFSEMTNQIITILEEHQKLKFTIPWIRMGATGEANISIVSGRSYQRVNQFLLSYFVWKKEYSFTRWATFKQIKELGGNVKRGEKAAYIYFFKKLYYTSEGKRIGEERYKSMSREQRKELGIVAPFVLNRFGVFNVEQTEKLPEKYYEGKDIEPTPLHQWEKDDKTEQLIAGSGATIQIEKSNRAYYNPVADNIVLPLREQFAGKESWASTAMHELGHWTGAAHRLGRTFGKRFGDEDYAKEELVAELCSAYLCAHLGFEKTITQNAAYLQSWIAAMRQNHRFIFKVSTLAQDAADYILEQQHQKAESS